MKRSPPSDPGARRRPTLASLAFASLVLVAPGVSSCALRPSLEGRACDDLHACVDGYRCVEGVCVSSSGAPVDRPEEGTDAGPDGGLPDGGRPDGGPPDSGIVDAGEPDAGEPDAGPPDAGEPEPQCPLPPHDDAAWLISFTLSPEQAQPPGAAVSVAWETLDADACWLHWLDGVREDLPPTGSVVLFSQQLSRTFTLRCTKGGETFEASRVFTVGPAVLDLKVGQHRTCAVLEGGVLKCYGAVDGIFAGPRLGDSPSEVGPALPRLSLADDDGREPRATRVFLGPQRHACALLDDGRLKCWGENDSGQLGVDSTASALAADGWTSLEPARLGDRRVRDVAVTAYSTCALFDDLDVACWGGNGAGLLLHGVPSSELPSIGGAPGSMAAELRPVSLDAVALPTSLRGGSSNACVLLDDDSLKCWGSGAYGVLGSDDTDPLGDDPGEAGPGLPRVLLDSPVTDVAVGSTHACAVTSGGVRCWGNMADGRLGVPTSGDGYLGVTPGEMAALLPVELGAGVVARDVAVGATHSCALTVDGKVKCWGANTVGALGLGDTNARGDDAGEMGDALPFVDVGGFVGRIESNASGSHTCAWFESGRVKCWGSNGTGQLGLGDTNARGDEAGEMGAALPYVDFGPLLPEAFTVDGARAALRRQGCTSCHAAALPPAERAYPPLDGCAPELVDSGAYPLDGLSPASREGANACLHWHLAEECADDPVTGHPRRVNPARPDYSALLRVPHCAGDGCAHDDVDHDPGARFSGRGAGSDFAYLFHWIARGAPPDGE